MLLWCGLWAEQCNRLFHYVDDSGSNSPSIMLLISKQLPYLATDPHLFMFLYTFAAYVSPPPRCTWLSPQQRSLKPALLFIHLAPSYSSFVTSLIVAMRHRWQLGSSLTLYTKCSHFNLLLFRCVGPHIPLLILPLWVLHKRKKYARHKK